MKNLNLTSVFLVFVLAVSGLFAQTATPSTTLCAAATATATSVCLTSTTNVVNQTGIYVDQEYMTVLLGNSQTLAATNAYVPVSRNNRAGLAGPQSHLNAAIAWLALTPDKSKVPGDNGFVFTSQLGDSGSCVRNTLIYLPHIYPDRGNKRDCNVGGTMVSGQPGVWVDYAPESGLDLPSPTPVITITTTGAIPLASGSYVITKASAALMTLAAPVTGVQDGTLIKVYSSTAAAHTITATTLLENGGSGAPYTTVTFGAFIGSSITLRAYGGVWYVVSSSSATLS